MGATELDVVALDLIEAIGMIRRRVRSAGGRPWIGAELTASEVDLVRLVRRRPGVSIAEAGEALHLAANSVSTLVRGLATSGWLVGERDPADRRVVRLSLTEPAGAAVEQWRDHRAVLVARALEALRADDVDAVTAAVPALARLAEALRGSEGSAAQGTAAHGPAAEGTDP